MTITAKIVADSISSNGVRLTTMELEYPRFIHSEFMTHRMFSRNASSSRAIPMEKMIKQVQDSPAIPIHWGKNQPGMQAMEELCERGIEYSLDKWLGSSKDAIYWANRLYDCGLHKQIVNRVLEPFQHIKVIVTATEWGNFFKLRLHPDAQPEMQELARCMLKAMEGSIPTELQYGEWYLPYINKEDCLKTTTDNFVKLSVARCARVSYLNHDNTNPNIEKDLSLADMLLESGHMSPMEHQATPMDFHKDTFELSWEKGITHKDRGNNFWSGNFRGWIMYRNLL